MFEKCSKQGWIMEKRYDYREVQIELEKYKLSDNEDMKKIHLENLLVFLRPLICKKIRHYFGFYNEDFLQDGYLKSIELIERFDMNRDIRFIGYMERMLGCYFFDMKKKQSSKPELILFDEAFGQQPLFEGGYFDVELKDLIKNLKEKEKIIVIRNIIEKKKLKDIALEIDVSYPYAKELKRKVIKKLQNYLNID